YKPTGVELAETGTVMLSLGETLQLNASLLPTTAKSELTWSTSAKKTATVDENGLVTPVKEGTATITVKTYNGKKDTVKVKVVDPKKVAAVELNYSGTVKLQLGETLQLNAAVLPATAETTLTWSSSSKKVATVDENGLVTSVKAGTTTITVKSANGKKDTVKVKVVK
ncbi:MAG: Ig-like domain-containing protein, partial [Clostridia bacterium]|nr:Ig-like domain-containing protein [Clostridia bacterium]